MRQHSITKLSSHLSRLILRLVIKRRHHPGKIVAPRLCRCRLHIPQMNQVEGASPARTAPADTSLPSGRHPPPVRSGFPPSHSRSPPASPSSKAAQSSHPTDSCRSRNVRPHIRFNVLRKLPRSLASPTAASPPAHCALRRRPTPRQTPAAPPPTPQSSPATRAHRPQARAASPPRRHTRSRP